MKEEGKEYRTTIAKTRPYFSEERTDILDTKSHLTCGKEGISAKDRDHYAESGKKFQIFCLKLGN